MAMRSKRCVLLVVSACGLCVVGPSQAQKGKATGTAKAAALDDHLTEAGKQLDAKFEAALQGTAGRLSKESFGKVVGVNDPAYKAAATHMQVGVGLAVSGLAKGAKGKLERLRAAPQTAAEKKAMEARDKEVVEINRLLSNRRDELVGLADKGDDASRTTLMHQLLNQRAREKDPKAVLMGPGALTPKEIEQQKRLYYTVVNRFAASQLRRGGAK